MLKFMSLSLSLSGDQTLPEVHFLEHIPALEYCKHGSEVRGTVHL